MQVFENSLYQEDIRYVANLSLPWVTGVQTCALPIYWEEINLKQISVLVIVHKPIGIILLNMMSIHHCKETI